jgi:hypothetical protein
MIKYEKSKTGCFEQARLGNLVFLIFDIVSDFGFRISNLILGVRRLHAVFNRQSAISWPEGSIGIIQTSYAWRRFDSQFRLLLLAGMTMFFSRGDPYPEHATQDIGFLEHPSFENLPLEEA